MNQTTQMALTLFIVAGAAWQLGLRAWHHLRNSQAPNNCGGCQSCPSTAREENRQLVQLELKIGRRS